MSGLSPIQQFNSCKHSIYTNAAVLEIFHGEKMSTQKNPIITKLFRFIAIYIVYVLCMFLGYMYERKIVGRFWLYKLQIITFYPILCLFVVNTMQTHSPPALVLNICTHRLLYILCAAYSRLIIDFLNQT